MIWRSITSIYLGAWILLMGAALPAGAAVQQEQRFPLRISGKNFVQASGAPFEWRGITAFRLAEMIASGREREAAAYLDWVRAADLTVVRVLLMAKHLFELSPEKGRAALPRLLDLAKARGIAVEVVALADTGEYSVEYESHIREVGRIAFEKGNALVELANEPGHPTQDERLHEASFLQRLAALVPEAVVVALGSIEYGEGYAAGDYATSHAPRGDRPWEHVTGLRAAARRIGELRKPLVSDEPIGAGEQFEAGRRDDSPERFRAAALLSRMAGMGVTFHYEDGLHARIPSGRQLDCFNAWNEAWALLPVSTSLAFSEPGDPGSPVQRVSGQFLGAYAAASGDRAWLLVVGARGPVSVTWAEEWTPQKKNAWPESSWHVAGRSR